MKSKFLPYAALFIASVLWGITSPVMKLTLESVPLFSLAFLRFAGAALLLYPFVHHSLKIKPKHYFLLLTTGFVGITLVIFFFFAGIKLTTAMNGSILLGTVPIQAVVIAFIFLKQRINKQVIVGLLMGILGIIAIFSENLVKQGVKLAPEGDILVLLAALSFAVYQIFSKRLFKFYRPLAISFYTFVIGAVTFLPFAISEYSTNPLWYTDVPQKAVFGTLFGIIGSSALAFSLWQWGLSKMEATQAGFFYYFNPVTGTIASYFLLGEQITIPFLIGSALIFAGVFVSQQHHKHHIIHHIRKKR